MSDDTFNPHFVFHSFLRAGDDIVSHVDRAIENWQGAIAPSVDRDIRFERLRAIAGAQAVRVDLWVEDLDQSSCVYGFLCSSVDGNVAYGRGERTLVNDRRWSPAVHARVASLRKDLPAYA